MWLETGFSTTFTAAVSMVGKDLDVLSSCSCMEASEAGRLQPQAEFDAPALQDARILTRISLGITMKL